MAEQFLLQITSLTPPPSQVTDEEGTSSLTNFWREDEHFSPAGPSPVPWSPYAVYGEEVEGAPLTYWFREDDLFTPQVVCPGAWANATFTDEEVYRRAFRASEDDLPAWAGPMPPAWWAWQLYQDDDGTQLRYWCLEDDLFTPQVVCPGAWANATFTDEEVHQATFGISEDDLLAWVTPVPAAWSPYAVYGEEVEGAPLTYWFREDDPYTPQVVCPGAWANATFTDEEVYRRAFGASEDDLPARVTPAPAAWSPRQLYQDDDGILLGYWYREDDLYTPQCARATPWASWTLWDDQVIVFVPAGGVPLGLLRRGGLDVAVKNQALSVEYTAWNIATNQPVTGDAANHTLRAVGDGTEYTPAGFPSEVDSANLRGTYKVTLQAPEMNYDSVLLGGQSSTTNVVIIPVLVTTLPATDPLSSQVPGAYAAGSAGYALGRLGGGQVTTVAPVGQGGNVCLIQGDSYQAADGRALTWTDLGNAWPVLTGAAISFMIFPTGGAMTLGSGSVLVATGSWKQVQVQLANADGARLPVGVYRYKCVAELAGGDIVTLCNGQVITITA